MRLILARQDGLTAKLFAGLGLGYIAVVVVLALLPASARPLDLTPVTTIALAGGSILAVATWLLPWDRLTDAQAVLALRLLMMFGLATVGALVAGTGGAGSDLVWSALLIIIFAAVVCEPGEQVMLYGLTVASYLAGSFAAGPVPVGLAVSRIVMLGAVAVTAGYLSGLLRRSTARSRAAQLDAQAHAARLSTVARGLRAAAHPDRDRVIAAVNDTVRELGWDHSAVYLRAPGDRPELVGSSGLPTPGPGHALPLVRLARRALDSDGTVTVADTQQDAELRDAVRELGTVSAIATRFELSDDRDGVVVASHREPHRFTAADVETFSLIATNAGRALELARLYAEERQRVAELQQLDRLRSEFLSTVSHELRTPLTVILGLSETLEGSWDRMTDEQRRRLLNRVHANSGGLDRTVSALLDFTRLEQGRLETRFETFDLGELVHTVVVRLGSLLDDHDVRLDVDRPAHVLGDTRLLERVLENLLTNAHRHTPAGTRVSVTCRKVADEVHVAVADDGPGIAEEDVARLGQRFFRAGEPGSRPERGTGLGLTLAQEVLRLHGSELRVSSEIGEGTRFSFALPATSPAQDGPATRDANGEVDDVRG